MSRHNSWAAATRGCRREESASLRREDFDCETLQIRRTAHEGSILEGAKTDHGEPDAGRVAPVPATTLAWMLEAQINLNGPDCELFITAPRGRLWRERNLPRPLEASPRSLRPRHPPHECRHSYVTHLKAAESTMLT
jgi:hypothetical protein